MIRTLKKFFYPAKNFMSKNSVLEWYLTSLAVGTRKHSLEHASKISGIHASQFSKLLSKNPEYAVKMLTCLSEKYAKKSMLDKCPDFLKGSPWKVHVIIDSTAQRRSASLAENVTRLNLGGGYYFGHRWTNIALFINGNFIPLPPIEYYSKKMCLMNKIDYKKEPECVVDYLEKMDFNNFIPGIKPKEVVFIMDAGYDTKIIQNKILSKGWDFLVSLKGTRSLFLEKKCQSFDEKKRGISVSDAFQISHRKVDKITCTLLKVPGEKKSKKFSVERTKAKLKGVKKRCMAILASKTKRQKKIKYLACSKENLATKLILQIYSLRFKIEQFHKEVKQYFGFEDVACHQFNSVISHTHLVYCVYILLNFFCKNSLTMMEKQGFFTELIQKQRDLKIIQLATRFDGISQIKKFFEPKIEKMAS